MAKKNDTKSKAAAPVKAALPIEPEAAAKPAAASKPVAAAKRAVKAAPVKTKAAPKARAKAAPRTAKPKAAAYTRDDVALRAYFIAEKRVYLNLPGDEHQDWVEAERQLAAESKALRKTVKA